MADWKNVHLAEQDEEIATLRARVEKLERGLHNIIRHYELMGGSAAKLSGVVRIAVEALAE